MTLVKCQQLDGAYIQQYNTTVKSCKPVTIQQSNKKSKNTTNDNKQLYECILGDTVLFPAGGGQNTDYGTLKHNDTIIQCTNVERRTIDGKQCAVHTIDQPIETNQHVELTVDWSRRYDHMQQHSTQHLISAIALNKYAMHTVSWSMSKQTEPCYIVFECKNDVNDDTIQHLEADVNEQIRLHTPINLHIFDSFDAAKSMSSLRLGAQFDSNHTGQLRVIEIENVDTNACCGTHLKNCSEMQSIVFTRIERTKQQIKLYFLAGNRVHNTLHQATDIQSQLNTVLSCAVDKHVEAATKLTNDIRTLNKRVSKLQSQLATYTVNTLLQQYKQSTEKHVVIAEHYVESNIAFMQDVADQLYVQIKAYNKQLPILVLTCTESDQDIKNGTILIYYSTSDKSVVDIVEPWFKQIMSDTVLNGKGGGKPGQKQGKVSAVNKVDIAVQMLRDSLSKIAT